MEWLCTVEHQYPAYHLVLRTPLRPLFVVMHIEHSRDIEYYFHLIFSKVCSLCVVRPKICWLRDPDPSLGFENSRVFTS
jgi:hypothetical protein